MENNTGTQDTKICPQCKKVNALGNLSCLQCGTSLINVKAEPFWDKESEKRHLAPESPANIFIEAVFFLAFLLCFPLGAYMSRWYYLFAAIILVFMIKKGYTSFFERGIVAIKMLFNKD